MNQKDFGPIWKEAKKAKAKSLVSSKEQRRNAALKQTSSSNAKELKSVMTTAKTTAFAPCAAPSAGPSYKSSSVAEYFSLIVVTM